MKNTIANNHLSKYGRFGDTEMYKTSRSGPGKGELWHVNEEEAELMDMYGQEGEKLVDSIGSGTINPVTGKEEKFMAAIALGSLALSAYSSYKSNKIEQKAASAKVQSSQAGIANTAKAQKELESSIGAQKGVLEMEHNKANDDLVRQTGYGYEESRVQHDTLEAKTGMASSGTVAISEKKTNDRMGAEAQSKSESLIASLGRNMGGLMEQYTSEKSRLKSEKDKFTRELSLAQDQANTGYFG